MRICVHIIFHAETVKFIHPDKQASQEWYNEQIDMIKSNRTTGRYGIEGVVANFATVRSTNFVHTNLAVI